MTTQVGRKAMNALDLGTIRDRDHPAEHSFGTSRFAATEVAFAAFSPHQHSRSRHPEPLSGCLVRFEFELFSQDRNSPGSLA